MSNRTAESQKAIREAWKLEQQRVATGKGTRDWTPEQQRDILENGLAHDENGIAFRGHHMKSAEQYPEYQGDPGNIQFLSHDEHKAAHIVCWQPTNWYYDPVTKERHDFGDDPFVPCPEIELSAPVVMTTEIEREPHSEDEVKPTQPEEKKSSGTSPPDTEHTPKVKTVTQQAVPIHAAEKSGVVGAFFKKVGHGIVQGAKVASNFCIEHKEEIIEVGLAIGAVVKAVVDSSSGNSGGGSSQTNSSHSSLPSSDYGSSYESDASETADRNYPETHASPQEHIVPAHGQHYHTKDGTIWKEKEAYPRGGKNTDE